MKISIAFLCLFLSLSAFGDIMTEDEQSQIERTPVLRCNVVKAPWYLYRAQKNVRKLFSCKGPICAVWRVKRVEKNFCKAVNVCDSLAEVLKDPCTEDHRIREELKDDAREALIEKSVAIVEKIKEEMSRREN